MTCRAKSSSEARARSTGNPGGFVQKMNSSKGISRCSARIAAHPQRRTRPLYRLGRDVDMLVLEVRPLERKRTVAPRVLQDGERLIHPAAALAMRHAEDLELLHAISSGDAEVEAAARDDVQ